jgi:uncharacterized coiled-coil protein SlyX
MSMDVDEYKAALLTAKNELISAITDLGETQNRTLELEQRIADLRQTISVLSKLCGEREMDVEEALGLTDAIRAAFVSVGKDQSLTAQEVRLRLEAHGFNTRRYGNLLASIHTVIKRLENKKEIRCAGAKGDKNAYSVTDHGLMVITGRGIVTLASALFAKLKK